MGLMRPLPSPEQVFLCWLVAQPPEADIVAGARAQIERLAVHRDEAGVRTLKRLFGELIEELQDE
ncbi:hypothetical protein [Mesorhizobium australicum]|uniref:Uncharacterized protein n=1 Tax=Mesorhizobium australicum TaxID=536018 RepID=A0A1X7PW62_9HYPH|nr:hypothetical protein [Mesorhizobium australicum]SMH56445.1 hypothetical protein SAMN02982922_5525 [Mesorhizobium australicum]